MREINFRAKNFKGEWEYGTYAYGCFYPDSRKTHRIFPSSEEVDEETLGQFTGLKDRNGKEVYEGDIIYFGGKPQIIKWSDTISGFAMWFGVGATTGIPEKFEVIGNIHENPELLEAKA